MPLKFAGETLGLCQSLTGVSVEAVVSCGRQSFRENILFTHRGLSGPAILQISSYWREGDTLSIDLAPDLDAAKFPARPQTHPSQSRAQNRDGRDPAGAPRACAGASRRPLTGRSRTCPTAASPRSPQRLKRWQVTPIDSEGWAKAEVTAGGIDTAALSSRTMEAREVPGLYLIGEAVDVTGWLGGYNFQWAWSSGWCAGQAL